MSVNRREEILARLFAILQAQDGFNTFKRNRALLDNDALPAVILLDGNETVRTSGERRGRHGMSPVIVTMTPQIFVLLKNNKPTNDNNVGTMLNTYRGAIIRAIATDAQLAALAGPNGELAYQTAETDLNTGMPLEGQMQINIAISCPLDPYN